MPTGAVIRKIERAPWNHSVAEGQLLLDKFKCVGEQFQDSEVPIAVSGVSVEYSDCYPRCGAWATPRAGDGQVGTRMEGGRSI